MTEWNKWTPKCGWSQQEVEAWQLGNWTQDKIKALDMLFDEHVDNCDDCQERLKIDPSTLSEDEAYFCPIGESLSETADQASVEYSWQNDYHKRPI